MVSGGILLRAKLLVADSISSLYSSSGWLTLQKSLIQVIHSMTHTPQAKHIISSSVDSLKWSCVRSNKSEREQRNCCSWACACVWKQTNCLKAAKWSFLMCTRCVCLMRESPCLFMKRSITPPPQAVTYAARTPREPDQCQQLHTERKRKQLFMIHETFPHRNDFPLLGAGPNPRQPKKKRERKNKTRVIRVFQMQPNIPWCVTDWARKCQWKQENRIILGSQK